MVGDPELKKLAPDSIVQIIRKGYYRCDSNGDLCTLIFIPDGTLASTATGARMPFYSIIFFLRDDTCREKRYTVLVIYFATMISTSGTKFDLR